MHSTKVNFNQERTWWDGKASKEELDFDDERINRTLRWRVIERYLNEARTILEVGGGTGAFSLPLARKGFQVTHADFSPKMIEAAKEKAAGITTVQFQLANATDLHMFEDRSFDLVLNMDGAISFCGSAAEKAVVECCRVAKQTTIVSVSNRAWMIPVWLMESLDVTGSIIPAVYEMFHTGFWHKEQYPENEKLVKDYFPTLKAFLPNELKTLLENNGMKVIELRAIGSLSNLSPKYWDDYQIMKSYLISSSTYVKNMISKLIRMGLVPDKELVF